MGKESGGRVGGEVVAISNASMKNSDRFFRKLSLLKFNDLRRVLFEGNSERKRASKFWEGKV